LPVYESVFEDPEAVDRYDRLRIIPRTVLLGIANLVVSLGVKHEHLHEALILDAGAGRGRLFLPIIHQVAAGGSNAHLIALDLSRTMLSTLQRDLREIPSGCQAACVQVDLQRGLPFRDGSASVVFTAATLHILRDWRRALEDLARILARGGYFLIICENNQFMHQTEGFERDRDFSHLADTLRQFMLFYHEQREAHGEPYVPSEVRYSDITLAIAYVKELGFVEVNPSVDLTMLRWQKPHTYDEILHCFRQRQMTTWGSELREETRQRIADALDNWVHERGIDRYETFHLPAALIPHILRKERS